MQRDPLLPRAVARQPAAGAGRRRDARGGDGMTVPTARSFQPRSRSGLSPRTPASVTLPVCREALCRTRTGDPFLTRKRSNAADSSCIPVRRSADERGFPLQRERRVLRPESDAISWTGAVIAATWRVGGTLARSKTRASAFASTAGAFGWANRAYAQGGGAAISRLPCHATRPARVRRRERRPRGWRRRAARRGRRRSPRVCARAPERGAVRADP
jgi:hypothetical protein